MATNTNDNSHAPQWRQLCQAAFLELDLEKLLQRIAEARNAVLDQIEDCHSRPSDREGYALRDALRTLSDLRTIAEREIVEQRKGWDLKQYAGEEEDPER